jgi:hypothetical protein
LFMICSYFANFKPVGAIATPTFVGMRME